MRAPLLRLLRPCTPLRPSTPLLAPLKPLTAVRRIVTIDRPPVPMLDPTRPGFVGKCVLAPMVRTGELPTRLISLKYGCDTVWSPEIVDKAIIGCRRVENTLANCIDFVRTGGKGEDRIIFRTHIKEEKEKEKCIFQIGTADPELAVEGAKVVAADVAGIDVNAGCPKHFSIHAGMGAALLKTPDKLVAILEALVNEIGKPNGIPVGVKIRIFDDKEDTLALIRRLCTTGICRITVHCRTTPMRPREPAIRDFLKDIVSVCHEHNVQCYANGDVMSRLHAEELMQEFGVDGCMIARAAEANPSVFRPEGALPWREVAEEYVRTAVGIGHYMANTKFVLSQIVPGKDELYQKITQCKSVRAIVEVMGLEYNPPPGLEEVLPEPKQKQVQNPPGTKKAKQEQAGKKGENGEKKGEKRKAESPARGQEKKRKGSKSPEPERKEGELSKRQMKKLAKKGVERAVGVVQEAALKEGPVAGGVTQERTDKGEVMEPVKEQAAAAV